MGQNPAFLLQLLRIPVRNGLFRCHRALATHLAEGEPAVRDYLGFLSGGCSKTPIELLRGAGVDMTKPQPVESALKLFGELLDEMEALLL